MAATLPTLAVGHVEDLAVATRGNALQLDGLPTLQLGSAGHQSTHTITYTAGSTSNKGVSNISGRVSWSQGAQQQSIEVFCFLGVGVLSCHGNL